MFVLIFLERQEAELLATRALVQTTLPEGKAADPAIEAFEEYCNRMFPFLEKATDLEKNEELEALEEFVKNPVRIDLGPIYKKQAQKLKNLALSQRKAVGIKKQPR